MTDMNRKKRSEPREGFFKVGWFGMSIIGASIEVVQYQSYLRLMQEQLRNQESEFRASLREKANASGLSEEDLDHFYEAHREESETIQITFPAVMQESFFISMVSFLEAKLVEICNEIEKCKDINKNASWLTIGEERGIERAKEYLKRNLEIFIGNYGDWSRIKAYQTVRHCLVHAGGNLELMRSDTKKDQRRETALALEQLSNFGISGSDPNLGEERIILSYELLEKQSDDVREFFETLESAFVSNHITGPLYWP